MYSANRQTHEEANYGPLTEWEYGYGRMQGVLVRDELNRFSRDNFQIIFEMEEIELLQDPELVVCENDCSTAMISRFFYN